MTKAEQIEIKKSKPITIGDYVRIEYPYTTTKQVKVGRGKKAVMEDVTENHLFTHESTLLDIKVIDDKTVYLIDAGNTGTPSELETTYRNNYQKVVFIDPSYVKQTFYDCGADHFKKCDYRINFYNKNIEGLLYNAKIDIDRETNKPKFQYTIHNGIGKNEEQFEGKSLGGLNFNPHVIDKDKNKINYQRDFVWTLEQKQLLIDSIYNNIEIGKFLFRQLPWTKVIEQLKNNDIAYYYDCVDGKQRMNAIIEFLQDKFPDSYGNYWSDLSENAQDKLLNYDKLSYGEFSKSATDNNVIDAFLTLNFTGTPMSKEHIEYIKSINI